MTKTVWNRILLLLLAALLSALPAAAAPKEEKPVVYFGVIPRYNPMLMYRSYQPIMDYLTENTPYRFELKLSRDYLEAVEFLRQGITPIASLGDVTFAEACEGFGAKPILKPLNARGEPFYYSSIIVREDSPIHSLGDLKGKSFAFGNLHSTSGNLIPRHFLFENGITLFDLQRYENLDSHDAVAKAVLKGKVDAGAVKDVTALRYKEHGLRILATSRPIPSVPIVVLKDAPVALVEAVEKALLAIDPGDSDQAIRMKDWDSEFRHGFVPAREDDYQSIFTLMKSIPQGCGIRCH